MEISTEYVEVHIFRRKEDKLEFLILKRSELETYPGMWQPVTGSIQHKEKAYETAIREVKEETNLLPERFWVTPKVTSFYIYQRDTISMVPVFTAEVNEDAIVQISEEHSEYKWVGYEEAYEKYAWTGQKDSLKTINEHFSKNSYMNFNEIKIPVEL